MQKRPGLGLCIAILVCMTGWCAPSVAQVPGANVNMVSGTQWPGGDPFLQRQNEPSLAVSSRNPFHILAGANDYRSVDLAVTTNGETGDAWLGLFKSLDGGNTWRSTLLPGCPYNTPVCGGAPAVQNAGFQAAADPTVRAGTNGMFYYAGLVFNRGQNPQSAIIVSRLIDLNNKENADPDDILNGDAIQYIDTSIVASGTALQFLDKPTLAVDVPRVGATACNISVNQPGNGQVQQSFLAGNVYVAYTAFAEKLNTDPETVTPQSSTIYLVRSTNCGLTWSAPKAISTAGVVNQGAVIAINPMTGGIFVAWRQFKPQSGNVSQPDAIVGTTSTDGGQTFSAPVQVSAFSPFDEGTTVSSFRTNAYPTATYDARSRVYVAYSARNTVPSGDARIVLTSSFGGALWTKPILVDNPPIDPLNNPSGRGHQIMPTLTFAAGRLSLLYYDLRLDHTLGLFTPLLNQGQPTGLYTNTPEMAGELGLSPPLIGAVFNQFIDDSTTTLRRHTFDLRLAQALPGITPLFAPSVLVSQYAYGCCATSQSDIEQLQFNAPNLPLFQSGTVPFMGDYVDLAPGPLIVPPQNTSAETNDGNADDDDWAFNISPANSTTWHAAWTDNRDVQAPKDGDWTHYTPPNSPSLGSTSIFDPARSTPVCQPGFTGSRNQNIYTAPISGGLVFGAPSNTKQLGTTHFNGQVVPFQRAFALVAQNTTNVDKSYRLMIANQPPGGNASFLQFSQLTTLDLSIPALSSATRPVFVTSTNPTASVTVTIAEITAPGGTLVPGGLSSSTRLNPDPTNPAITNPAITNPAITNPPITSFEVTNPAITNPAITNPAITNPAITNPAITNPAITNSTFQNVSEVNPAITNPAITNPAITNASIANPAITNPAITNVTPNESISDTQWTVTNTGNTEGPYTVNLASTSNNTNGNFLQLIISKLYQTPQAPSGQSCELGVETHNVVVTNIKNPALLSPTDPAITNPAITNPAITNATVALAPGESANIILRVVNPDTTQFPTFNAAANVQPVSVAQAVNTQTALSVPPGGPPPPPPVTAPPLQITTTSLPSTVTGSAYSASIQTAGGNLTSHTFSITSGAMPLSLQLDPNTGAITGTVTAAPGTFPFVVQAQDVGSAAFPQHTATQNLSITVLGSGPVITSLSPTPLLAPSTPHVPFTGDFVISGQNLQGATVTTDGPFVLTGPAVVNASGTAISQGYSIACCVPQQGQGFHLFITTAAGSATLTDTVALTSQVPANVSFVSQPSNSIGGQTLGGSPVVVQVTDRNGLAVAGIDVTMSLNGTPPPCAAATLSGTLSQVTNVAGQASFPDLSIDRGQLGYTLSAAVGNASAVSNPFTVNGFCAAKGQISVPRELHSAVTLLDGTVLVAGGGSRLPAVSSPGLPVASAELYNPSTGTFSATASMHVPRWGQTTTLLRDGRVLVAGGVNSSSTAAGSVTDTAEIYDPATHTFTFTNGPMNSARFLHTATLLADGRVLVAGGGTTAPPDCIICFGLTTTNTAEIFDPATGLFTPTSTPLVVQRQVSTATLMPNGQVLLAGGLTDGPTFTLTPSAEIFDPVSNGFRATSSMAAPRALHSAALLPSGKVLVAGGTFDTTATAELYDSAAGTFAATGNLVGPSGVPAIVLTDGTVLLSSKNPQVYSASTGLFTTTGALAVTQTIFYGVSLLQDGTVLTTGGETLFNTVPDLGTITDSEIYYSTAPLAPISITTTALFPAATGKPFTQILLQQGGVGNLTWTVTGLLPAGMSFTNQGILIGTPTVAGSFPLTFTLTDSSNPVKTASTNLTLTVTDSTLTFTSNTVPTAAVGRPYAQALPVVGGTQPYNGTVTAGTLPPGMAVIGNMLTGTPTGPGNFTFTVSVTDSSSPKQTATQTLTMSVDTLVITTTVLPDGIFGVAYSASINTAGGTFPFSFSLASGALPPGLQIQQPFAGSSNATLFGTPTQAGTFTFSESVTDSSNPHQTATQNYVVTIDPTGSPTPANLTFLTQPQNSVGGQALKGSPLVVQVTDANNSPIPGTTVTMGFNGTPPCPVAVLSGTVTAVTDATGRATFPNLSVDRGGWNYELLASTGNLSASSGPFSVQGFCGSGNLTTQREGHTQNVLGTSNTRKFPVDPQGAYVFTNINPGTGLPADNAHPPLIIRLADFGVKQGDILSGVSVGDMAFCPVGSSCYGEFFGVEVCGVFSSSNTLIPTSQLPPGSINRIPGAIALDFTTTAIPCNTPPTLFGNLPTDIAQDFAFFGERVTVPLNAQYLFVAVSDSFYTDNSDANGDFGVAITLNSTTSVNSQVLIAGGFDNNNNALNTAELYNPAGGFSFPTGNLTDPNGRGSHASVVLPDGRVLLIGGISNIAFLNSAELYDPSTGTFAPTGNMTHARANPAAVLLADGRVLVAGGTQNTLALNTAEIYDPKTGQFTPTGNMKELRVRHTMTLLPNGKVLVTGGRDGVVNFSGLASAELFDPNANIGVGAFIPIGNMSSPRFAHAATLLSNGTVLVSGGFNGPNGTSLATAETFDPATNTFTLTGNMITSRARHRATLLPDGSVLEVGGIDATFGISAAAPAELYNPATRSFSATGSMITGREFPEATLLLPNGNVLVSGGDNGIDELASTEVYFNTIAQAPIVITTTAVPNGIISQPYVQLLQSQNKTAPIFWSLTAGTLPPGITLTTDGILSGTPTTAGSFTFTVQVTDGISTASATFTNVTVSLSTLAFTSNTMPTAGAGRAYSQPLPVTGGTLPYNASVTGGSLPPGLALSSTGVLSGTPTSAGSFTFTVTVTDSAASAQTATQTLTMAVDTLFITTTALPSGIVGVGYNAAISTSGGTLPLVFSTTPANGAFPPGLTIQPAANPQTGALVGTPTQAGHYTFTETVSDSSSPTQTAAQYYTMDIFPALSTAAPAHVTFIRQPQDSTGGQILAGTPIGVNVTDIKNAPIQGASVAISFNGTPPCRIAVLSGTLSGTSNPNGDIFFPDLSIDRGQLGYTLLASAGSASAVSQPFTVNGFCPTPSMSTSRELFTQTLVGPGTIFPVDPVGAYVTTAQGDTPHAPLIIPLASVGIKPDDVISGFSVGDMSFCAPGSNCFNENFHIPICGLFSSSNMLLPTGTLHRVPGAIAADATVTFPCNTFPNPSGLVQDISQDFTFAGEPVTVPANAAYLFVAVNDDNYGDNVSVGGDLGLALSVNSACPAPNKVLLAGGIDTTASVKSTAELFDPATGATCRTGNLVSPNGRALHAAVALKNGKVLLLGGQDNTGNALASAELYDPATGTFSPTGSMAQPRLRPSAVLLADGRVLVAGGHNPATGTLNTAEIYDPATGAFTPTGNLNQARARHTMTLLTSGKVLVAGGRTFSGTPVTVFASAELFDPNANNGIGAFTFTGNMNSPRDEARATLLSSGKVLIAGGFVNYQTLVTASSAETFDPATNTFTLTTGSMSAARAHPTASLLPDGRVVVAGGVPDFGNTTPAAASADVFDPNTRAFSPTGAMTIGRELAQALILPNGNPLVSGGDDGVTTTATQEIYYSNAPLAPIQITTPSTTAVPPGTTVYTSQAAFAAASSGDAPVGFNGIIPTGQTFAAFNPLVVSGITFSTPLSTQGVNVNVTKSTFYTPNYPADIIVDSVVPATSQSAANNTVVITLPAPTFAFGMDFGGLGFKGPSSGTITLSNGFVLQLSSLPTVGTTEFRGFVSGTPFTTITYSTVNDDFVVQDIVLASPEITLPSAATGQPYTQILLQQGGLGTLTWGLVGGTLNLPPGILLTQDGILRGTPTASGTFTFTVRLTDSSSSAKATSATFVLTVNSGPLVFGPQALPTAIVGGPYTPSLVASGGTLPLHFGVSAGTPPAGITLGGNGVFGGTPTAAGSSTFTVTVTDSSASPQSASQSVTIQVVNPLAIATSVLPSGTANVAYSASITSSGGVTPVSFAVTSGTSPPGLALASSGPQSATLSGTPTASGTFTFTITATDTSAPPQTPSQTYTVTIAPNVVQPATVTFVDQPANSIEGQVIVGHSPVQVRVVDINSVPIPNVPVTIAFNGAPPCAAATLAGTLTQNTDATGTASFADLIINRGQRNYTLAATAGAVNAVSTPFNVEGFCETGSLASGRAFHSAVALPNGKILVAGGVSKTAGGGTVLSSAELYNPATHSFTTIGSMNSPRETFTMTLLQNGLVLVAGGLNGSTDLSSAELFDPTTNIFTLLSASMVSPRNGHVATPLSNGKILITGGIVGATILASAEIFDPAANTFTATSGQMTVARLAHHADLLPDGRVLVTGGQTNGPNFALASAEIYDPAKDNFTSTGSMITPRFNHASALLFTGKVLVAGGGTPSGSGSGSIAIAAAELFDPSTGTFSSTASAIRPLSGPQGSVPVLSDGSVFLDDGPTNAQIYDPAAASFRITGNMTNFQVGPQAVTQSDGTILVTGGGDSNNNGVSNAEIFYPASTAPISITTVLPTAFVNQPYTDQLQQIGGIGNLTWIVSSGTLPTGFTLSPSGLLSGTGIAISATNFTVQVTDSSTPPRTATQSYVLVVVQPVTVLPTLPTANPGVAYNQAITVLTGTAPFTFSFFGGTLPAGLTLASNGTVTGTTTAAPGTYFFTVKVTDSSTPPVSDTQLVAISVAPPLAITTTSLPNGTVAVAYNASLSTSGGLPPIQFLPTTALPPGLSLSLQGVLSGTPASAGTFSFSIQAFDASVGTQFSQTQSYTIQIAAGTALALAPASLPNATLGVAYTQGFTPSGGLPPYNVSLSGTLPTGLAFNGASNPPSITGTPSLVGTFTNITVTVTDSQIPPAQLQITYTLIVVGLSATCGTGQESLLNGSYVIIMQGFDANGPRTLIGGITLSGTGLVPSGQVDLGFDLPTGGGSAQHLAIIPAQSSYSVGSDLRGCLVLTTSAGSTSYRLALAFNSNGTTFAGHIIEFQQGGTFSSGLMRRQDPVAVAAQSLNGPYAFAFTTASSLANVGHWAMLGSFSALNGSVNGQSWDFNNTLSLDGGTAWPATGLQFPANETYAFDGTGRGTIQLPSVQQFSANQTLASANFVTYVLDSSEMFAAVIPDVNNKPLVGDIQQQVTPFDSLTLNGAGYVEGVSAAPIFSGAWVGGFSARSNNWNLSLDNDFAGTYSTAQGSGTYAVDANGRTPLAIAGSTASGPMVRVIGPNKIFFMLTDGTAALGFLHSFPGGTPLASVAGTYSFGSAQGSLDRKVTNIEGIAVFDAAGNVTFTQDQANGTSATLSPGVAFTSTYSYNAATGRGVIPPTGTPHFVFWQANGIIYLLDVTSVDPAVQELFPVAAPSALTLSPNPLNLVGGATANMTVTIGSPAPANGVVVSLSTTDATVASVPASVTILQGATSATFSVTAGASVATATITASATGFTGGTALVNVTLRNMTITLPGPLLGVGRSFDATVTLDGPAPASGVVVSLGSSDTTIATVSPATFTIPSGATFATFTLTGVSTGPAVTLTASAPGFQNAVTTLTITASLISLQSGTLTVAPGQSSSLAVSLSSPAGPGGVTINFASGNIGIAMVTASVFVPQGQQTAAANPQVTGVSFGSTLITASATGFAPDTSAVQVTVAVSFNPANFSVPATRTSNIALNISVAAPQPNGVTFNLSSDATNFATVPATATIPAGQLFVNVPVTGVAQGTANLSASSSGIATATAVINVGPAPTLSFSVAGNLGQDLQVDGQTISLGAAPPSSETLTLASNSASVLLSASPSGPFSQSINLALSQGSTSGLTFSMQGLAGTGSAQLTATANGYSNGTATVNLAPSGFQWLVANFGTTTFSPDATVTLAAGLLDPNTLVLQAFQNVRTGLTVNVTVTSSASTVGTIVTSPVVFNGDTNFQSTTFHSLTAGTTNLVIATPTGFSTPSGIGTTSIAATVTTPTITFSTTTTLGQNLQVDGQSINLGAAPPTNRNLTLTSNSANLLLANTPTGPFSQSITLQLLQGSSGVPPFSMQGLANSGSAQLTATAAGYANGTVTVTLAPSGFQWLVSNFNTTTFSPDVTVSLAAGLLDPNTLVLQAFQNVRTGLTVSVTVTSSNTTIGTIVTSPVVFNPDTNFLTTTFHPLAAGSTNLVITTPTGFATPSGTNATSIAATVTAPTITVSATTTLGQNLQVDGQSISLGAAPPTNRNLTLTSNSANLLLANTPTGPFSQSITLQLLQGSSGVPPFSMQSLANSGSAQLTATATGYTNGTATVTLAPSGFQWLVSNFNTTTFSPDVTVSLAAGLLDPNTLVLQAFQNVRTGLTVNVTVTSSATTVGTIVTSPVVFNGDTNFQSTAFHPLTAGTTNLAITTPTAFSTPSGVGATSISATVTAPTIAISAAANLGLNLQADGQSISLGAVPPNNETLTLTSSSANVLLANTPAGPFTQSINLSLLKGSSSVPSFSMQGLAISGSAQLTAQAPGYSDGVTVVNLTPSGFQWFGVGTLNTTSFSPDAAVSLAVGALDPNTLMLTAFQNIRTGLTVNVTVTSSNTAVGTIVTSPVVFAPDTNFGSTAFHPIGAGTTNLVITTPAGFTTPNPASGTAITATVSAPTIGISASTTLGQNLQVDSQSIGLAAGPPSSRTLTLTSNSANLLLANTPAGPFTQSINLALTQGSTSVPPFSMQSLASSGNAQLTATATGYMNGAASVNLTPSGFQWFGVGTLNTTSFSPDTAVSLAVGALDPNTLTLTAFQNIRTGLAANVTVTSSNTAVGTIVTSPVVFAPDTNFGSTAFHPVGAGTTNLVITTPAGFTTPNPASATSITATVSAPTIGISASTNLGQNLQVDSQSISLAAGPPADETLTITSNSAALLLSATPNGTFTTSVNLQLTKGSTSVPSFSMQSLGNSGSAQLTATATGYMNGTASVNLTPSGFQWFGVGALNTTSFSPDTAVSLAVGALDPNTLTLTAFQNIRTGLTVNVTVTSSNTAVGTIVTSPVVFAPDTNFGSTAFHPVGAGTANLVITTPAGFTTPNPPSATSITATVSAPTISISTLSSLGQNLQLDNQSIGIAAAPPSDRTLTLSSNSAAVLLAATPAGPFSQSISLQLTHGSSVVPNFTMQGLTNAGTAQLTASASGYTSGTMTINLTPSAIIWSAGDFSTTVGSSDTPLQLTSVQLNPSTLTAENTEVLRTGASVSVNLSSSVPGVGTITSPVVFPNDSAGVLTSFHALASGSTILSIATPNGFTTPNPAGATSITATVQ